MKTRTLFPPVALVALFGTLPMPAQITSSGQMGPSQAPNSPSWTVPAELSVGYDGPASLTIASGGTVTSGQGIIGWITGSDGIVMLNGGSWTTVRLAVGHGGTGTLNLNSGSVSTSFGYIARNTGSTGTVTMNGGEWINTEDFSVGQGGNGTLNLNNGLLSSQTGYIGRFTTSSGTATVGSGGEWRNSGELVVAEQGPGSLTINGGRVSNTYGYISRSGGTGSVTVNGGSWVNSLDLQVGGSGTGTLNLLNGTVSSMNGVLGESSGFSGTVNVSGGTWTNAASLTVGSRGSGSLNLSGGTVSNTSATIGRFRNSNGIATVSGGTWSHTGSLVVGFEGRGELDVSGGTVISPDGRIGLISSGNGTATVRGGTWLVSGDLEVGWQGNGTLNISSGTVSNAAGFIARDVNSTGTATVSGGTWTNTGDLLVGRIGSGTLNLSGGMVSAPAVSLGALGGVGVLNLTGGVLATGQVSKGFGNGGISFNGGTLRLTGHQPALFSGFKPDDEMLVGAGGTIDTQGFTVGTPQVLSGNGSLTKQGIGSLTLQNPGTYTGGTTVSAGTLALSGAGSLANTTAVTVAAPATFTIASANGNRTIGSLAGAGSVLLGNNNLTAGADHTSTTFSGGMAGTGGAFTKTGTGHLTFTGTNTYNANTFVQQGTLQFARPDSLPSSLSVTIGATAAFNYGGPGDFTMAMIQARLPLAFANGSFLGLDTTHASTGTASYPDNLTQPIGFVKLGSGTLVLSGTNTYPGGTLVNGGLVEFSTTGNFGTGNITLNGGGLRWAANNSFDISPRLDPLGTGGGTFDTNSNPVTLASILSGSGSFTKNGTGTLTLTGANTYLGGTIITGGLVEFSTPGNLGPGNITLNGGGLRWAANNSVDISPRLNPLGLGGGTFDTGSNPVSLTSVITGGGSFTKNGPGTLTLTARNTYTGGTVVHGGTLLLGGSEGTGVGIIRGDLTINSGATVRTASSNAFGYTTGSKVNQVTINEGLLDHTGAADQGWGVAYILNGGTMRSNGGVSSSTTLSKFAFGSNTTVTTAANSTSHLEGRVDLRADGGVTNVDFITGPGSTLHISAAITSSGANPVGLTKSGPGTLTLSGANPYTGGTTITAGILTTNGTIGDVTISSGGTLGGTGTVRAITLNGGGLAPGNSPGTLTATSLAWNSGVITMELGLNPAGSDHLVLSGALTGVPGPKFFTFADNGWVPGQTYPLITFGSQSIPIGDFGATNGPGLGSFSYRAATLQFTVVPEPGAATLLALGIASALAASRRRARQG